MEMPTSNVRIGSMLYLMEVDMLSSGIMLQLCTLAAVADLPLGTNRSSLANG